MRGSANPVDDAAITITMASAIYGYAFLTLGLPFIADLDPPIGVFLAVWLGDPAPRGYSFRAFGCLLFRSERSWCYV